MLARRREISTAVMGNNWQGRGSCSLEKACKDKLGEDLEDEKKGELCEEDGKNMPDRGQCRGPEVE